MKERKQAKCNKVANKWVKYYGAKCTDTCCISIAIWSLISVSCRCGRCAAAPLSISFKSVEWMASLLVAFSFPRTQKHRLVCVFTHADLAVAFFYAIIWFSLVETDAIAAPIITWAFFRCFFSLAPYHMYLLLIEIIACYHFFSNLVDIIYLFATTFFCNMNFFSSIEIPWLRWIQLQIRVFFFVFEHSLFDFIKHFQQTTI